MIKKILIAISAIIILAACTTEPEPDATEQPLPGMPTVGSQPADTQPSTAPLPGDDGYPVPGEMPSYPPPLELEAYPEPPSEVPTPFSYPQGTSVWVIHAMGLQCEDPPAYPDLKTAIDTLAAAEINIQDSEEVGLMVCEACGCPTSTHFRILIDGSDLPKAINLGWRQE